MEQKGKGGGAGDLHGRRECVKGKERKLQDRLLWCSFEGCRGCEKDAAGRRLEAHAAWRSGRKVNEVK